MSNAPWRNVFGRSTSDLVRHLNRPGVEPSRWSAHNPLVPVLVGVGRVPS
jgi:hypothetical protein